MQVFVELPRGVTFLNQEAQREVSRLGLPL